MSNTVKQVTGSNVLKPEYWTAINPEKQKEFERCVEIACDESLDNKEAVKPLADFIVQQFEDDGVVLEDAYFIRHFVDIASYGDEINSSNGLKYPHVHWLLKSDKRTIAQWSKGLGVGKNFIEKLNQGKYSYNNSLAYLIHAKYQNKTPYLPTDVYTARGQDYVAIYNENIEKWDKGKSLITQNSIVTPEALADFEQSILKGSYSYDDILLNEELSVLYVHSGGKIDKAFEVYHGRKAAKARKALRERKFRQTNIFITGLAGAGKTYYANKICSEIIKYVQECSGETWEVYEAASTNPLDDYRGEEIVLFNDVSSSSMEIGSWKLLLDPYDCPTLGARYKNKAMASRVNIITSTQSTLSYFYHMRSRGKEESIDQLQRRIDIVLEVNRLILDVDVDIAPDDENTRIAFKSLVPLAGDNARTYEISNGSRSVNSAEFTVRFIHESPKDIPVWLRPSDAIALTFNAIAENNSLEYTIPERVLSSIQELANAKENIVYQRDDDIVEKTTNPRATTMNADSKRLIIKGQHKDSVFDLEAMFKSENTLSIDLYSLKDHLDELIVDDMTEYASFYEGFPQIDFNPFLHRDRLDEVMLEYSNSKQD